MFCCISWVLLLLLLFLMLLLLLWWVGAWVRARDGQEGNAGAVEAAGQCSRKERLRGLMCSKGRDESTRASLFE